MREDFSNWGIEIFCRNFYNLLNEYILEKKRLEAHTIL